jgi:hypothetical protein
MLMMILAATTAAAEVPPQKAQPSCSAGSVLVEFDVPTVAPFGWSEQAKAQAILVSKIIEPDKAKPEHELLPRTDTPSKGPAVLTPECKPERRKKKDYPLA